MVRERSEQRVGPSAHTELGQNLPCLVGSRETDLLLARQETPVQHEACLTRTSRRTIPCNGELASTGKVSSSISGSGAGLLTYKIGW
jgi:hypothetical protein